MSVTYIDAIHQAMSELLEQDPSVFLYGQDIAGNFGGAFKATKGLHTRFPERVINSPISEDAMIGLGMGAALAGMKPIVEMQFADFSSIALNQFANNCASHYYRTGQSVNITLRLPCGGTAGGGPFHSQSLEALFAHFPGLHVFCPASVADAYQMLKDAVSIPDPVVFMEHKYLYRWLKAESWQSSEALPPHKARIARSGRHATIITYSAMLPECLRAADELAASSGYEIEVLDLRCIKPLDSDSILASVARTGRVLVVSEDFPYGGVAAEVIALIASEGLHLLDAPPMRLNSKDCPIPQHPKLWAAHRPSAESILPSLRYLLSL